jgi:serine/threonine-protein kinase
VKEFVMVPPIPLGTLLRQRYLIQQILGQGGFGRTYLAIDQERFNEPCVLKEFTVPYQECALVEKSKTLFQREASTLYQLQHPQVPRFWAAFEDEQRLFLVQSFISGQTYRQLLSNRKHNGHAFSEAEVLHFLSYLLPVLTYLHDREIIHRDISPENIILQTKPVPHSAREPFPVLGLPVLIDFGAVKEATSHWPLTSAITRVGKVGYAPPEQLQTGKVYPNSDLYALGATCLALLTGKEPRALLDSQTLSWRWQTHAQISTELAAIIQKMLSVFPGDRYQSADAVLADLQPLLNETKVGAPTQAIASSSDQTPSKPGAKPTSSTLLQPFSSQSESIQSRLIPAMPALRPQKQQPTRRTTGAAIAGLVGLGIAISVGWQHWHASPEPTGEVWVSGTKLPQSEASRLIESQESQSAPLSTATIKTSRPAHLIQFPPNQIATVVQGALQTDEQQPYILKATQGQIMTATLAGSGMVMNLLRSNQEAIDAAAYQTRSWTGQLPADDQYIIQVSGSGLYTLDLTITPTGRPNQVDIERLTFTPRQTGTSVTGTLSPNHLRRYLLAAQAGQLLVIKQLQGKVNLSAIAPNGQRIGSAATNAPNWQGRLPIAGDYVIEVSTAQVGNYALSLELF